ncbi:unnamed protein product, partial [Musa hybrid cultivar]
LLVHVHDDKPGRSSAFSGYTRLETGKCSQRYGNPTLLSQPRAKRGLSWEARKGQKVGAMRVKE